MVRAKDINVRRLLKLDELPDHIDTTVDIILSRSQAKKKMKHPELADQYRYVCAQTAFDYIAPGSSDEYHLSLRIVRFKIDEGIYTNVITNLNTDEFSCDDIKDLYKLRWAELRASFCFAHLSLRFFDFTGCSADAWLKRCA